MKNDPPRWLAGWLAGCIVVSSPVTLLASWVRRVPRRSRELANLSASERNRRPRVGERQSKRQFHSN